MRYGPPCCSSSFCSSFAAAAAAAAAPGEQRVERARARAERAAHEVRVAQPALPRLRARVFAREKKKSLKIRKMFDMFVKILLTFSSSNGVY